MKIDHGRNEGELGVSGAGRHQQLVDDVADHTGLPRHDPQQLAHGVRVEVTHESRSSLVKPTTAASGVRSS